MATSFTIPSTIAVLLENFKQSLGDRKIPDPLKEKFVQRLTVFLNEELCIYHVPDVVRHFRGKNSDAILAEITKGDDKFPIGAVYALQDVLGLTGIPTPITSKTDEEEKKKEPPVRKHKRKNDDDKPIKDRSTVVLLEMLLDDEWKEDRPTIIGVLRTHGRVLAFDPTAGKISIVETASYKDHLGRGGQPQESWHNCVIVSIDTAVTVDQPASAVTGELLDKVQGEGSSVIYRDQYGAIWPVENSDAMLRAGHVRLFYPNLLPQRTRSAIAKFLKDCAEPGNDMSDLESIEPQFQMAKRDPAKRVQMEAVTKFCPEEMRATNHQQPRRMNDPGVHWPSPREVPGESVGGGYQPGERVRVKVFDALCKLLPGEFSAVLSYASVASSVLSGANASQAIRAAELVQHFEAQKGNLNPLIHAIEKVNQNLLDNC